MSYARFGVEGSDVYLYASVDGMFTCLRCTLTLSLLEKFPTRSQFLAHIDEHRAAGHTVPADVDEVLKWELLIEGETVY